MESSVKGGLPFCACGADQEEEDLVSAFPASACVEDPISDEGGADVVADVDAADVSHAGASAIEEEEESVEFCAVPLRRGLRGKRAATDR